MELDAYRQTLQPIETKLLGFLRTFEKLQEEIQFAQVSGAQQQLQAAAAGLFPQLTTELAALTPPEAQREFHAQLSEAAAALSDSYQLFLGGSGRQFAEAFLNSRNRLCRALYVLYEVRAELPGLAAYWVLPETLPRLAALETRPAGVEAPVGFFQQPRTERHMQYTLYVPEAYSPEQSWPLIVCLHGGYGRGDEYIWTWLRPAKSNGYLLLSPKSAGPTWSVLNPPLDVVSIQAMVEEVCAAYAVDRKRVFLTGLSDGGTFTYLAGLSCPELFAGAAVIAGDLNPTTDPLLRRKQGIALPLAVIHGVKDFIFDVRSVRQSCDLLKHIGYQVAYTELPEWGHALTYSINERLVLPWFESLR
ncbi:MAG: hypothetical protein HYZ50_18620 [Deltaproteobacteria bacterium]|nr:hypothetical protein [Deltaproteobacteria bacterium]